MKPIIIQGAMDVELAEFQAFFCPTKEETWGDYVYYHGSYQDYPIILSKTGIGMVNAAAATALALCHFSPVLLLNQGLAGAHDLALNTGDIVLSESVVSINSFEKPLRKEGIDYQSWLNQNFYTQQSAYLAEPSLLSLFQSLPYTKGKKIPAVLGSGDVWNREWEFIQWLQETLGTASEDMETYGMFQLAAQFQVPAMGVRIISNNERLEEAYDPSTAVDLQQFIIKSLPSLVAWAKEREGVL